MYGLLIDEGIYRVPLYSLLLIKFFLNAFSGALLLLLYFFFFGPLDGKPLMILLPLF